MINIKDGDFSGEVISGTRRIIKCLRRVLKPGEVFVKLGVTKVDSIKVHIRKGIVENRAGEPLIISQVRERAANNNR